MTITSITKIIKKNINCERKQKENDKSDKIFTNNCGNETTKT